MRHNKHNKKEFLFDQSERIDGEEEFNVSQSSSELLEFKKRLLQLEATTFDLYDAIEKEAHIRGLWNQKLSLFIQQMRELKKDVKKSKLLPCEKTWLITKLDKVISTFKVEIDDMVPGISADVGDLGNFDNEAESEYHNNELRKYLEKLLKDLEKKLQKAKSHGEICKLVASTKVRVYKNISEKHGNSNNEEYTALINSEVEKYREIIDELAYQKIKSIPIKSTPIKKQTQAVGLVGVFAAMIFRMYVWCRGSKKPTPKASNALSLAVQDNNIEDLKRLLDTVDINTRDSKGRTALHWAVKHQRVDMVKLLLDKGADLSIKDRDGYTPLGITNNNLLASSITSAKGIGMGQNSVSPSFFAVRDKNYRKGDQCANSDAMSNKR